MSALEAELNRLPRLNGAVPTQARGGVWIVAADRCIPSAAQAGIARISPTHIPAVDCAAAFVGDADRAGKPRTPIIANHITAVARCGS